jgi:hypothetical protein
MVDTSMSWSAIKDLPVYGPKGINTMRKQDTFEHFGNPFVGSVRQGHTTKVDNKLYFNTIAEAVQAYKDWLKGTKHQDVNPQQRQWILNQLNSGNLVGKTLLYYSPSEITQLNGTKISGYKSHADVLAELINQKDLRSAPISQEQEETCRIDFNQPPI